MIEALLRTIAGTGLLLFLFCIIACGLNEWIAVTRGTRGRFLKMGIRRLLPDQPVFRRVMQHPLISGMSRDAAKVGRPSSHLSPANFAGALLDVVRARAEQTGWEPSGNKPKDLEGAACAIKLDHPLIAQALLSIYDRAGHDFPNSVAGVEAWFNASMERVQGWYIGFTRVRIFWLALLCAALANVDALQVVRFFWNAPGEVQAGPAGWPIGHACLAGDATSPLRHLTNCVPDFSNTLLSLDWWLSFGWFAPLLAAAIGWTITATAVAVASPYLYRLLTGGFRR